MPVGGVAVASKKELKGQQERDEEHRYLERFLGRLSEARTVENAVKVERHDRPGEHRTGRRRHTNLLWLLKAIKPTGSTPPYRVSREYPLPPNQATREEIVAYCRLIERLAGSGEISKDDAEYMIQVLSPASRRFVDLV